MNNTAYSVLIIDDDQHVAEWIKKVFEEEGDIAHICTNPRLAVPLALNYMPQLIIVDVHMSPMSGFEVAIAIKNHEELEHIPLVFISGSDDLKTGLLAFSVGAASFIKKPINAVQLIQETNIMKDICQFTRLAKKITESKNK